MMKNYEKWILGILFAWLMLVCWFSVVGRRSEQQAETQVRANQQVVMAAEQHIAQTNSSDQVYRKGKQAQAASLTPQTALAELQAHLPQAEIGTEQAFTSDLLPEETRAKLPESPGYVCLSDPQLKAIAADQLTCDADRHSLAARESDVTDLHTELAARTAEAHAWERAAKGGSRWQRFGRVLKYTGCAAAGAGAGALVSKQTPTAAAIGGAAGVAGCSLF